MLSEACDFVLDNAPDGEILDDGVPMDQHVSKSDNLWQSRNQLIESRLQLSGLHECLADYYELPFHTRPQKASDW